MSVNYAAGLSNFPHIHKGKCGLPEIHDSPEVLEKGIKQLVELVKQSKHMVVHTGAGISTAAGIPDFRGPKGVWTLEAKGKAPQVNINFDDAIPTKTHMAILALQQHGIVKYVVSQNIDGLHMRSGYPRSQLSELHGNMFTEKCEKCNKEYYRRTPVSTMTQKRTGNLCTATGKRGLTNCRGKLRDTILDWEDSLPTQDLNDAENETKHSDLSLCLGTTLQIVPSGKIPLFTLKNNGQLVIVNLQKTKYDKKADVLIHAYVDDVMEGLLNGLGITIPTFSPEYYLSLLSNLPDDINIDTKKLKIEKIENDKSLDVKLDEKNPDELKCEEMNSVVKCGNGNPSLLNGEDEGSIEATTYYKEKCEEMNSVVMCENGNPSLLNGKDEGSIEATTSHKELTVDNKNVYDRDLVHEEEISNDPSLLNGKDEGNVEATINHKELTVDNKNVNDRDLVHEEEISNEINKAMKRGNNSIDDISAKKPCQD